MLSEFCSHKSLESAHTVLAYRIHVCKYIIKKKKTRGRPRMMLLEGRMKEVYSKLKERAGQSDEWRHFTHEQGRNEGQGRAAAPGRNPKRGHKRPKFGVNIV